VFGTDKLTKLGYCKGCQYKRTDLDRRSITVKGLEKAKKKAGFFDINKVDEDFTSGVSVMDEAEIEAIRKEEDKLEKEQWFKLIRSKLVGTCQCGCGNKSQKYDDTFFRGSCCHIFPKSKFHSIKYHPLNYVERAMFGGCHSIMDDTSIDRWVNFADWDDIKAKFYVLSKLVTDKEKSTKFYSHLEKLINENN
jgi:hypothetical protein